MRFLLDTHIFLWSMLAPERLFARAREVLSQPDHELFLSPISVWEICLLSERGRVSLRPNKEKWLATWLPKSGVQQAPFTHEIAIHSRRIKLPQQDPADRFLAATAAVCDLTLITADGPLRKGRGYPVLQ